MEATWRDIKAYVQLMNDRNTRINPKEVRFQLLEDDPGGDRVRARQGHSAATLNAVRLASAGGREELGVPYLANEREQHQYLLHGINRAKAQEIYQNGLLAGGPEGYREHVHLVQHQNHWTRESGQRRGCRS